MKIAEVRGHASSASQLLHDAGDHLASVAEFLEALEKNPMVTGFEAAIPGELGEDAMAILNGLLPMLVALGGRSQAPAALAIAAPAEDAPAGAGISAAIQGAINPDPPPDPS